MLAATSERVSADSVRTGADTMTKWLTYSEAAHRVGRTTRNIRRWHADGMVMEWRTGSDNQRERVVDEEVLLAWFRDRLKASPTHYYRVRAIARELGLPDPALPAALSRVEKPKRVITQETAADSPVRSPAAGFDPLDSVKPMRGGPEYVERQGSPGDARAMSWNRCVHGRPDRRRYRRTPRGDLRALPRTCAWTTPRGPSCTDSGPGSSGAWWTHVGSSAA